MSKEGVKARGVPSGGVYSVPRIPLLRNTRERGGHFMPATLVLSWPQLKARKIQSERPIR